MVVVLHPPVGPDAAEVPNQALESSAEIGIRVRACFPHPAGIAPVGHGIRPELCQRPGDQEHQGGREHQSRDPSEGALRYRLQRRRTLARANEPERFEGTYEAGEESEGCDADSALPRQPYDRPL